MPIENETTRKDVGLKQSTTTDFVQVIHIGYILQSASLIIYQIIYQITS